MIKGHLPSRLPLDVVEIDHTPLNVYVIDNVTFLPLGRPSLTAIKDRHTSIILGFYVSFRHTGLQCIFGAIKHSLQSHHYVRTMWPDLNDWPAFGLGANYVSDRGGDFVSLQYQMAITSLGAQYSYNQRRTPWLKGSIERFFRTLDQTFFEAMPGKTFSCLKERKDYDPKKDSVVRFSTFIYLLHKWCVNFHNVTTNERKQKTPLQLWNESIQIAPPIHLSNMDRLDLILGEHHSGRLTHEGLQFEWLHYADDGLHEVFREFGKNLILDYIVSQDNLGHIQVKHPKTGIYFPVQCTRADYAERLTLYQHRYIRKVNREAQKASPTVGMLVETRAQIQADIRKELSIKNTRSNNHFARITEINSNRLLQGETQTIQDPFAGQAVGEPLPSKLSIPCSDTPFYGWG
jgi:putative transposase